MALLQQILFILAFIAAVGLFTRKIDRIRKNILLGRDEDFSDNPGLRWKNVLLLAFGQKKMFRNPLVAVLHFFIYAGFIIINLEVLEIALDGLLGTHRLFAGMSVPLYLFLIDAFEVLALTVLVSCVVFLCRRNILKLRRFISHDLDGWPRSDANYILLTEIVLMTLFLTMNAADTLLQSRGYGHYGSHLTGDFLFSRWLHPLLSGMSDSSLVVLERVCWWGHILGILAFLNYLPYSKHLHILLAFPNAYYARLQPEGKFRNMPVIQQEVLYAMQPELAPAANSGGDGAGGPATGDAAPTPPPGAATAAPPTDRFGVKDVFDLSWRNLLDAYSCTECGRCSAACPANITGKLLSPRKIMMATRDRLEEVGKNIGTHGGKFEDDGKNLLNYISVEELRACTTCNACVEECPVSISPLEIIVEMRRAQIMEDSNAPQEWNALFGNIENNFAPWKFSPDDRDKWATELNG